MRTDTVDNTSVGTVYLSGTGRYVGIIGVTGGPVSSPIDGITIYDTERDSSLFRVDHPRFIGQYTGLNVAFYGDSLVAVCHYGKVQVFALPSMEEVVSLNEVLPGVMKFSNNGKLLAIGKTNTEVEQSSVVLVDVGIGEIRSTLVSGESEFVFQLYFTNDGQSLHVSEYVTPFYKRFIYIWDIETSTIQRTISNVNRYEMDSNEEFFYTAIQPYVAKYRANIVTTVEEKEMEYHFHITPNVVEESALINYSLSQSVFVQLHIISIDGNSVGTVFEGMQQAGSQTLPLMAHEHPHLANGQYFLQMSVDGQPKESLPFIINR